MIQTKERRALIIGGLGFIGSNVAHRLVASGWKVRILDACISPYGWNHANISGIEHELEDVVKGDVREASLVSRSIQGCDFVFNFAGQVGREISMEKPYFDLDVNCRGALNILEACRRLDRKCKVLFAGSRGQIGEPVYLPVDEKHPDNPTDIYGIHKLAAEKYHLLYHKVYGLPTVSLRLNNVYGPRCQMKYGHYGVLNLFIRKVLCDESITVYGDGQQTRDYVYIEDVVDAFVRAALNPVADGQIFLVGSGKETKFMDMVKAVFEVAGKGHYVHRPFPPNLQKIDILRFVSSYKKLERLLGWKPKVSLKEGLEDTVAYYRKRLGDYL